MHAGAPYVTSLLDQLTAGGQRDAIREGEHSLTYAALVSDTFRTARALQGGGVKHGDGLVYVGGNGVGAVLSLLAAHVLGLRFTAVHQDSAPQLGPLDHILKQVSPTAIVIAVPDPQLLERTIALARPSRATLFSVHGGAEDGSVIHLPAAARSCSADPIPVMARGQDIARISYTSGTTGVPKGVAFTFGRLAEAAAARAQAAPPPPGLRFLVTAPFAHAAGAMALGLMRCHAVIELFRGFDARQWLSAVDEASSSSEKVAAYLYPRDLHALMASAELRSTNLSSLALLSYGSAPAPASLVRDAAERFGPVLSQTYAQTEAVGITALSPVDHIEGLSRPDRLGSVGRPLPSVDVRIVRASGEESPRGEPGEVTVTGPVVMDGYWEPEDRAILPVSGGRHRTGDVGYFDEEGYLHLVGRTADAIVIAEQTYHPQALEYMLTAGGAIRDAAVIGVPGSGGATEIAVYAVASEGADESAVREAVEAVFLSIPSPRHLQLRPSLPLLMTGKVDRVALRQEAVELLPH